MIWHGIIDLELLLYSCLPSICFPQPTEETASPGVLPWPFVLGHQACPSPPADSVAALTQHLSANHSTEPFKDRLLCGKTALRQSD